METQFAALTAFENFLYGLKAKESKRQYPHRLDKFLTFIGLQGTIEEKCTKLYELSYYNELEKIRQRYSTRKTKCSRSRSDYE
jgi:hypothetical protein